MNTVLATGGLGFIGSHTCLSLLENNYNIYIIDSLINSSKENFIAIQKICNLHNISSKGRITFLEGDILDKYFLIHTFQKAKLEKNPIKAVIHFAGLKSVNESIEDPISYWETNVYGTINLLRVMKEYGCKKLVFSSSATVYKPFAKKIFNEKSELGPINPYGSSKLAVENLLRDLVRDKSLDWKIINLRYFNPVGAHPSGLIGESPKGKPNNLFPILLKVASGEYKTLSIFGKDWPTRDGTCIRDFIHIVDLAEAHIAALEYITDSPPTLINLNIGTGRGHSVLEVVETFKKVNKCELKYLFVSRREGDAASLVADNTLALSTLNWSPKRSLKDMCRDAWRWKLNN
tara:strand:- start:355 stop:1395 length:1041 start_codon:yes stop_codon:yes gene_type:complete